MVHVSPVAVTKARQENSKAYVLTQLKEQATVIEGKHDMVDKFAALRNSFTERRYLITQRSNCTARPAKNITT